MKVGSNMKQREVMVGDVKYIRVNRAKAEKIWSRDKEFYVTAIYERFPDAVYGSKDCVRRNAGEDSFMAMTSRHLLNKNFCNPDVGEDLSYYVKEEDLKQLEQEVRRSGFSECEKAREERRKVVMGVSKVVLGTMIAPNMYEALFYDKKGKRIRVPQKGGQQVVSYNGKKLEIPFLYRSALSTSYNLNVDRTGIMVDERFIDKPMVLLKEPCFADNPSSRMAFRATVTDIVNGKAELPDGTKISFDDLYPKIGVIVKDRKMTSIPDKDEYVFMDGERKETFNFKKSLGHYFSKDVPPYIRSEIYKLFREVRKEFLLYGKEAAMFYVEDGIRQNKERELNRRSSAVTAGELYDRAMEDTKKMFSEIFTEKNVKLMSDDKPPSRQKKR